MATCQVLFEEASLKLSLFQAEFDFSSLCKYVHAVFPEATEK